MLFLSEKRGLILLNQSERNLALALRPQTFEEVVGLDNTIAQVKAVLAKGQMPSAWLFSGKPGAGKTTLARILSRYIQGPGYKGDTAYDIQEINAANFSGVDDVRAFVENSCLLPMSAKYRVYIFDEAQRLSEAAQQVLLKEFEDTAPTTVWIVCTTAPSKMNKALLSRCTPFALPDLDNADVAKLVRRVLDRVAPQASGAELVPKLIENGVRSPRHIVRAVDCFLAGKPVEEAAQGEDHNPTYFEVAQAVAAGNWGKTRGLLKELDYEDCRGLRNVVTGYLRAMLLKADGDRAQLIADCIHGVVVYNPLEDGLAYSATVASLFKVCRKLAGGK